MRPVISQNDTCVQGLPAELRFYGIYARMSTTGIDASNAKQLPSKNLLQEQFRALFLGIVENLFGSASLH